MSKSLFTAATMLNTTPQTEKANPGQVKNSAGGYVFKTDAAQRFNRFLCIGTDGGTYYATERDLTKQNVDFLGKYLASNEADFVQAIVDVSTGGRAYKQSPALFALAFALVNGKNRDLVRNAFNKVVRTGTHLFETVAYIDALGGWGRAKRSIVANWYESQDPDKLAYQTVKYRSRKFGNGAWTHRDVMRLAHPENVSSSVADFVLGKEHAAHDDLRVIFGFKEMQQATTVANVLNVLHEYEMLPWETIPTQFLKDVRIWKALFANGQLRGQALVRQVTRLAKLDAFTDMKFAAEYATALADKEMIARTRLHPINFLNASVVYNDGQMDRREAWGISRNKTWRTNGKIADALTEGFHESFKHVEAAGRRTLVAVDVSGSMSWSAAFGLDLTAAQVSAAVAMTVARTEPYSDIVGFSTNIVDLGITPKDSLADAMRKVQKNNFGGTDAAAAIVYAQKKGIEVEHFIVVTDNETYAGRPHPFQALNEYRRSTGIEAKLSVLGVSSTGFSIADQECGYMMDFVGFDSSTPKIVADFAAGRL